MVDRAGWLHTQTVVPIEKDTFMCIKHSRIIINNFKIFNTSRFVESDKQR